MLNVTGFATALTGTRHGGILKSLHPRDRIGLKLTSLQALDHYTFCPRKMQRLRTVISAAVSVLRQLPRFVPNAPRGQRKLVANGTLAMRACRRVTARSALALTAFAWLTSANSGY